MKYHHLVLFCFAFASILSTRGAYSDSKVNIYTNLHADPEVIQFDTKTSATVTLHCNTTESGEVTWERNDKVLTEAKGKVSLKDNNNTIILKNLTETDVGNYTCVVNVGTSKYRDTVLLNTANRAKWGVRVAKNINVVEGEKLTIKCDVKGDLTLQWWYTNTTSGENATLITENDERYQLHNYYEDDTNKTLIVNGELKIEAVDMGDRGDYTCDGIPESGEKFTGTCTVRIKDKYAALWPFLGICAEVFVLCAIIFIYEKKRNKTELEESDTDQSPDQKNTPDHGKESNLRHRQ